MTILVGKHIDQIDFDSGRRIHTLPVVIGERTARFLNIAAICAIYAIIAALIGLGRLTPFAAIVVFAFPRAIRAITLMDLEAFGKIITDKKICIGVIDHHSLQVERPEEIAEHIRRALKHIPAERLVLSSDCGMGREGMSRRHAYYKIVSMVLGTNIVRKELGLPQADCLAADTRYSLVVPAK